MRWSSLVYGAGRQHGAALTQDRKIDLKEVPTESALPYGIQINPKGIPIFCELGTNKMSSIDPQTLAITEYKLPESVRPRRLRLLRMTGVLHRFQARPSGYAQHRYRGGEILFLARRSESNPYGIAITPDGMAWYSESGVQPNTIVQFDPKAQKFARANIPSGGGVVRNMVATPDGRIYIACSGVDKVGVVAPSRLRISVTVRLEVVRF